MAVASMGTMSSTYLPRSYVLSELEAHDNIILFYRCPLLALQVLPGPVQISPYLAHAMRVNEPMVLGSTRSFNSSKDVMYPPTYIVEVEWRQR